MLTLFYVSMDQTAWSIPFIKEACLTFQQTTKEMAFFVIGAVRVNSSTLLKNAAIILAHPPF